MSGLIGARWKTGNGRSRRVLTDEGLSSTLFGLRTVCYDRSHFTAPAGTRARDPKAAKSKFSSSSGVHSREHVHRGHCLGGWSEAVPPVPIPHTAVKRLSADDTFRESDP